MKITLSLLFVALAFACSQPLTVTTKSDPHTATSGTLGSAKFNNQLPQRDTGRRPVPDSLQPRRDSLPTP